MKQYGAIDVALAADLQVIPSRGYASQFQYGYGLEKSFDGVFSTNNTYSCYFSPFSYPNNFPIVLTYYFSGDTAFDYLTYYPYQGNGYFGKVDIEVATNEGASNYTLQGNYDFAMKSSPTRINLKGSTKATAVKFTVHSGLSGFATCDEMQFFQTNPNTTIEYKLLSVFKDITCSELKEGVTDESIQQLPGNYFINIAEALRNDTYTPWEKEFRIREYKAYSDVEVWATKLMTKRYSDLDNLTGISVEEGDEMMVLVGDTYGQQIILQCIGEELFKNGNEQYLQIANKGACYNLIPGVNKLTMTQRGQLFVMYNTDLTTHPKPIKIHIPIGSGKVNGFFDLKEHKTDERYAELLFRATDKYFCIRGEKIMFYFHTEKLRGSAPDKILSAINLWDNIIGWQQELMGVEDVLSTQMNNHLFAISPEGSYMWASDYRIGFVYTYLHNILLYDNVMAAKDNVWGPAHEIGHVNQKAISWPGSSESSNNLFSNYVLYKLGKYCSRGTELSALALSRCIDKDGWWNLGSVTHQNEDAELHMRMNWQLWNYYHRCGYKRDFWQQLFKLLRENRIVESDPGAGQLLFAKMACRVANENLTDFFEMWGFFEPVNTKIEQYGNWDYIVTPAMIADAKSYMAQFPAPKHAFYYLEDRKNGDVGIEKYQVGDVGYYSQFKENQKITKNISCKLVGQMVTIENGEEAVAFEVKKGDQLMFFSNFLQFSVPASVSMSGCRIYAVQADGKRIALL